jgi:hypothetical protein
LASAFTAEGAWRWVYSDRIMVRMVEEPWGKLRMFQATWEKLVTALHACGRK